MIYLLYMNEQDNKNTIDEIRDQVVMINKKLPTGWRVLLNGILSGFGYVVGIAFAIALLGYFLNILGIIPAFRTEVDSWKQILERTQNYK